MVLSIDKLMKKLKSVALEYHECQNRELLLSMPLLSFPNIPIRKQGLFLGLIVDQEQNVVI